MSQSLKDRFLAQQAQAAGVAPDDLKVTARRALILDVEWKPAVERAESEGRTMSEVLQAAVRAYGRGDECPWLEGAPAGVSPSVPAKPAPKGRRPRGGASGVPAAVFSPGTGGRA